MEKWSVDGSFVVSAYCFIRDPEHVLLPRFQVYPAGRHAVTGQKSLGHPRATTRLNTYAHLWHNTDDRTRTAAVGLA